MQTSNRPDAFLSPFALRDLQLQNRVVLAPLTRGRSNEERVANSMMAEYYEQRSGAGLVITEATSISEQALGWVDSPGIYNDAQADSWRQVVDAVHAKGSKIFLQLWHCGRASHSDFHGGDAPVSASAIKLNGEGLYTPHGKKEHEVPRALETNEIPGVVADYVAAAKRAKSAGFDGIEVHSANGYLLDQFLQSKTNQRADEYGGSLENRFRLLREILEGVTKVFGAGRVGVRLSPNGVYNDMGSSDFRETFTYVAEKLDGFGLAYLHLLDGLAFGFHELGEPMTLSEFRAVFKGPLMGNCGYDAESADAAIASGDADMIAIGRPYISNPDYVERLANGWPLAEDSDPATWFTGESGAIGYTNFPNYDAASETSVN